MIIVTNLLNFLNNNKQKMQFIQTSGFIIIYTTDNF